MELLRDALRGPVDPAEFKTYVFPMPFWKWVFDSWAREHAEAVADYGDDVDPDVEADYHRFDLPDGTRWDEVTFDSEVGLALHLCVDRGRHRWSSEMLYAIRRGRIRPHVMA